MKNKIFSFIVIALIVVLATVTSVFASYADFGEEEATKKNEEMIKEQEKEHNVTEVKSSDNYLSGLQVDGYTLTPEFDKQTLEYTIKEEVKSNEINIKTTTSNEKANVTGAGKIKIEDNKNEHRIDVTAENGSVRTYIIKLNVSTTRENKKEEAITKNETSKTEEVVATKTENDNAQKQEENSTNTKSNPIVYIMIAGIVVILVILLVFSKNKKGTKRKKHKSKH